MFLVDAFIRLFAKLCYCYFYVPFVVVEETCPLV